MRKIVIKTYAGFAGTDSAKFVLVPDSMTDEELSDYAWHCGLNHAEMYGVYPSEYNTGESDEDTDDYSDDIEGWWEEYDPEKHDGLRVGNEDAWMEI